MWAWLRWRYAAPGKVQTAAQNEAERQLRHAQSERSRIDRIEADSRAALNRRDDFTAAVEQALRRLH